MNGDLLRIVEAMHREKDIDREVIFQGIEAAVASATKKHYGKDVDIKVVIDRQTGSLTAYEDGHPIEPEELGRIAAQSAKQMMIQKIREAESDVILEEYESRKGTIITGQVLRYEGGSMIVNLGKTEGVLSRKDLIPGDSYRPGDTIRALIIDVQKVGAKVRIILSRTDVDFIIRLFEIEVPEIPDQLVVIRAIARNPGYRTKLAIESTDPRIDCVGACVGVRGGRIKNIVSELNGEKIDIIQWDEQPAAMIVNALKPAEISGLEIDEDAKAARVIVTRDQLSLAIGKRGQNVRLASKLTGWQLDIITDEERQAAAEALAETLQQIPEISEEIASVIASAGFVSAEGVAARGAETLTALGIPQEKAEGIIAGIKRRIEEGGFKHVAPARKRLSEEVMDQAGEDGEDGRETTTDETTTDEITTGESITGGTAQDAETEQPGVEEDKLPEDDSR